MLSIFITGTNRGIGLAFVREYLTQGERVFAACRLPEGASHLQQLKQIYGDQLILINNAGVFFPSTSIADLRLETLTQSFTVNSLAPLLVSQALLPLLQTSSSPKIVNVTAPTRPRANCNKLSITVI